MRCLGEGLERHRHTDAGKRWPGELPCECPSEGHAHVRVRGWFRLPGQRVHGRIQRLERQHAPVGRRRRRSERASALVASAHRRDRAEAGDRWCAASVTVKDGMAALDGLKLPGTFAEVRGNDKQVQAMGNGGAAALLGEVQVRKGHQPSSGYLLKPAQPSSPSIELVAWNTGEPVRDYNASHAEHQINDI